MDALASGVMKRAGELKGWRSQNWDSTLQEIAEYLRPHRSDFNTQHSPGEKRREKIFDSSPITALSNLAGGLQGNLVSSVSPWAEVKVAVDELNDDQEVKEYLEVTNKRMRDTFNRPDGGWNAAVHELFLDIGAFGTGVMLIRWDDQAGIIFRTIPIAQCYVAENAAGKIDTVYRCFKMTTRQLMQQFDGVEWPKAVDPKRPDDWHSVTHAVFPREDAMGTLAKDKPVASIFVLDHGPIVLRESGFDSFPYMVPRWTKIAGETYGRGPGHEAIADVRMLNAMAKTIIRSSQKIADPPLVFPDDGFIRPLRAEPSSIIYKAPGAEFPQPLQTGAQPTFALDFARHVQQRIENAFFAPLIQQLTRPGMTATEALIIEEERQRLMAPIIGRLQSELLGPAIDRVFMLMNLHGKLPDAPEVMKEAPDLQVEYLSPLAKVQMKSEVDSITRIYQSAAGIAQATQDPSALAVLDHEEAIRKIGDALGVSPQILKPPEQMQAEKKQAEQQQQAQMAMQMGDQAAGMAQKGGAGMNAMMDAAMKAGMTGG